MSKQIIIPNFIGGLNTLNHPTQLELNEAQTIENMEIVRAVNKTLSLQARQSYKALYAPSLFSITSILPVVGAGSGVLWTLIVSKDTSTNNWKLYTLQSTGALTTATFDAGAPTDYTTSIVPFGDNYFAILPGTIPAYWDITLTAATTGLAFGCQTGASHKNRMFYGSGNRLFISDVGNGLSVPATSYIDVGYSTDGITNLIDTYDKLVIIKGKSVWYLYLAANLADSQLIQVDPSKGTPFIKSAVYANGKIYVLSNRGVEIFDNGFFPLDPKFFTKLNNTTNYYNSLTNNTFNAYLINGKSLTFDPATNQLIATLGVPAVGLTTVGNTAYYYDLDLKKGWTALLNAKSFCPGYSALGSTGGIFTPDLMFIERVSDVDPTSYIRQMNNASTVGNVESSIQCVYRTGDYSLNAIGRMKKVNKLVINFIAPNSNNNLVIKSYGDLALKETKTVTPNSGYNSATVKFNPEITKGKTIGFQFEYTQSTLFLSNRYSLLDGMIDYTVEEAVI